MSKDLLIEIGLEEMPARYVTDSMNQFGDKVTNWFKEKRISFDSVELFSTPRRLAVIVKGVAEKQEDIKEEAKGPAKKIAQDENGNWTKAAEGFARGQQVDVTDLYFKEINGVEYVHVNKFIAGVETFNLLTELKDIIISLHFPKNMRWKNYDLKYIRPIQWLCAIFGDQIIPFEITNVQSGNESYGHRFLGQKVTFHSASDYVSTLEKEYVIVHPEKRKQIIREQIAKLGDSNQWNIPIDEELLEEVNNLVEYPTALNGTFDEAFLIIPDEVLITSMKEHQRYFPVKGKDGKLLPYFITVRNGNNEHLDIIAKGNEKVLRARLSDAQFFYQEDQKTNIDDALKRLETIVFHEDLGTTGDKVRRVKELAVNLASVLKVENTIMKKVERAAAISKFDLVSNMVYEFPELQGIMGEKYARLKGEDEEVAIAINEHYMPRGAADSTPTTETGAILSIAEKMDTIVGFFGIGLVPTGSQDPYALRRQAQGIVQTLKQKKWDIRLEEIIGMALNQYTELKLLKRDRNEVLNDLIVFFTNRIKNLLQESHVRYDIIDATLHGSIGKINEVLMKAQIIMDEVEKSEFKEVVEALCRITNIAAKAETDNINPDLFEKEEEKTLYNTYLNVKEQVQHSIDSGDVKEAYNLLAAMKNDISQYFDNIMVMADDEKIKSNRLAQMKSLASIIYLFADFNKIVFK